MYSLTRKEMSEKSFIKHHHEHNSIHFDQFQVLEEDEIAHVQKIFDHFDLTGRGRVATTELSSILQLLEHDIGKVEEKELQYEIDKKGKGFFQMPDLITLLCNTGFEEHKQNDLLKSLYELDDDADGYIDKDQLAQVLTHSGEGLSQNELKTLMELACEPESDKPDLVNIKRLAEILIPEVKIPSEFGKRVSKAKVDGVIKE